MLLAIIVAMGLCLVFGLPVLPVLIFGAFAMCGLAYCFTKSKALLNIGLAFGMIACSYVIMAKMPQASVFPDFINAFVRSQEVVGFVAVSVIIYSAIVGIFGPLRKVPLTMDDVLAEVSKRSKDADSQPKQ